MNDYKTDLTPKMGELFGILNELTNLDDLDDLINDEKEFFRKYSTSDDITILFSTLETKILNLEANIKEEPDEYFNLAQYYYYYFLVFKKSYPKNLIDEKTFKLLQVKKVLSKCIAILNKLSRYNHIDAFKLLKSDIFLQLNNINKVVITNEPGYKSIEIKK